ncbi:large ribosomal subunit protein P2 isoform X2 [Amia ocellicauda]|uniref:large ribosomal subunit protein P2 isoform X2 n=1 Tax=Amia ocellicauda TaxID=2972642 RepID=UPI003464BADF
MRERRPHILTSGSRPSEGSFRFRPPSLFLFRLSGSRREHAASLSDKMRYVAAYLLAALGGTDSPNSKDLKKILDSVGIEVDDTRMDKVINELNGKNVADVIAQGYGKLASVPAGGAVAVCSSATAGGAAAPAAVEEKKEEKKDESEESDDDMGFGLFD